MLRNFFIIVSLVYSTLALFTLPLIGCFFVSCAPASDDRLSVSQLLHREPLSTAFAYFGGIWLLAVLYLETTKHRLLRYIVAFLGAKFLSVPLVLPLGSVNRDVFHDTFALTGVFLQLIYTSLVIVDVASSKKEPFGAFYLYAAFALQVLSAVFGLVAYWISGTQFQVYTLVVVEYVFGIAMVAVAFVTDYFHF